MTRNEAKLSVYDKIRRLLKEGAEEFSLSVTSREFILSYISTINGSAHCLHFTFGRKGV